uniref:Uncharacterized protein n=1 Tax=Megaselia scalaris TaxID=36166 RepID=T1GYH4_MEGSC
MVIHRLPGALMETGEKISLNRGIQSSHTKKFHLVRIQFKDQGMMKDSGIVMIIVSNGQGDLDQMNAL